MNFEKMTDKAQAAIIDSQKIGIEEGHQQLESEHLHLALLRQQDGLIAQLLRLNEVDVPSLIRDLQQEVDKLPKVQGGGDALYASRRFNQILANAEKFASDFKDEFISVEHLYLGLLEEKNTASSRILAKYNISREGFLQSLNKVRGNQRVTSQSPESNYDALNKYGRDLVDLARKGKLDPVIGRDSEIRHTIQILSRRTKNNPVLIGEPGVGKTAVVEGLAQRILDRKSVV